MSEAKHTPGPWQACGHWVCEENDPGHNVGICRVEKRPGVVANARLIAAAPDLLAALQDIIKRNEIQHWFNLDLARAAVTKATGA